MFYQKFWVQVFIEFFFGSYAPKLSLIFSLHFQIFILEFRLDFINIWDWIRALTLILWKILSLFSKSFPVQPYESFILQVWKRCVLRNNFTLWTLIQWLIRFRNYHFLHKNLWGFKLHIFVNVLYAVRTFVKDFTWISVFLIKIWLHVAISYCVLRSQLFKFLDFYAIIKILIRHRTRCWLPVK